MLSLTEMNKRYRLYDNLGSSLDRYTLVDMNDYRELFITKKYRLYSSLAFSENLITYCEHTECMIGKHLWKRIDPFDFPDIQRIISEVF